MPLGRIDFTKFGAFSGILFPRQKKTTAGLAGRRRVLFSSLLRESELLARLLPGGGNRLEWVVAHFGFICFWMPLGINLIG